MAIIRKSFPHRSLSEELGQMRTVSCTKWTEKHLPELQVNISVTKVEKILRQGSKPKYP